MPKQIIIDCERMKYPHTGLYNYCYNLGIALQKAANPASEGLTFFLPRKQLDIFGRGQNYLVQNSLHKLILPSLKKYAVWHCTHQDADYFPSKNTLPIVLTIHDFNILHNKKNRDGRKKAAFISGVQKKINQASHVTFISSFTKRDVQQYIDLGNKPVSVIYNGCNIKEIEQLIIPAFAPTFPYYFTIGTIMEKKNFHVLPALLVGNDRQLIIAGITQNENYKQKIINEAMKYGVANRLIFTGPISENDKQWYLKNCEAFVFPSIAEGFGLPVVEAMYFGVPIFLSSFTSLPEIGGDVCYYFSSFEKESMQQTIKNGLAHYTSTGAQTRIKRRAALFNWGEAAAQYLEVYRSLY
ncbi:N/A [soil metagenome]